MNAQEREERKDMVMGLIITGYTQREIARKLKISKKTITNYVTERREETIKELNHSVELELADMEIGKRKRVKKLWATIVSKYTKATDRNKAIQLLQAEESLNIKRKQLAGLLPPDFPAIAIQNTNVVEGVTTIADSIRRLHPELMDKFKSNKTRVIQGKINEKKD